MSDAIKKRQERVELCRDLLLSIIHDHLTTFRQAVTNVIDEHNKAVPLAKRVVLSCRDVNGFDPSLIEIGRFIRDEVTDLTTDIIYEMSHAIEEEDAETP